MPGRLPPRFAWSHERERRISWEKLGSLHVEEHQTTGQRDFGRAVVRPLVRREHLDV